MTTWRRWQDWVVVGLGALMFVTPFVFGETANSVAAYTACVLGALIALAGLLNGAMKDAGMAPFKAVLDQKDAAAIRAYLIKRANEDKAASSK